MRVLLISLLASLSFAVAAADVETNDIVKELTPKPAVGRTRSMMAPADAAGQTRNLVPERASVSLQIKFDFDSARVSRESESQLEKLAAALTNEQLKAYRFSLEGHTDAKGRADYNQRLSERRAEAVKAVLVQRGVEPARLAAAGKGSTEPANAADPLAPENRRVRIVNLE